MDLMPIEHIPDWERRIERQDAFWQGEILDRPVVTITLPKAEPEYSPPEKTWDSLRDRWFDAEYAAEKAMAAAMNNRYLGDALPHAYPNLGPEVFSSFFGTEMEYGDRTSWSIPNLENWAEMDELQFSTDNVYWDKLMEITDVMLEMGQNRFYTGMTDLHPGGDAIAAFRDPAQLAMDLLEHPDEVKVLLRRVTDAFFRTYDAFADRLIESGQAICTWAGIVSSKRWYVPSNDFSCMISNQMFEEFFLPGIAEECEHLEASIYHLDGPNALQHLDSLLELEELDAVQWVYGAGRGPASEWLDVYKRCQDAGKGLQIRMGVEELDTFMEELRPEGLWIGLNGVDSEEHAEHLLSKVEGWT